MRRSNLLHISHHALKLAILFPYKLLFSLVFLPFTLQDLTFLLSDSLSHQWEFVVEIETNL